MKAPIFSRQPALRVLFAVLVLAGGLQAGGPLLLRSPGLPFQWMGDPPTAVIHPDAGSLGSLAPGTALTTLLAAAENWEAIGSSSLRIQSGGEVGSIQGPEGAGDFAVSNVFDFLGVDNGGVTPIVFDSEDVDQNGNGDIFDALGLGFGILGIGFPEFAEGSRFTEGMVILNGPSVDPDDVDGLAFRGIITHELGHLINLAHSVVNGQAFFFGGSDAVTPDGIPMMVGPEHVETMYPFGSTEAGGSGVEQSTPHLDDIAILSTIYPNPVQPLQSFGSIQGRLLDQDSDPRTGGQMIVRNQSGDPLLDAVSAISGDFAGDGNPKNPFAGGYILNRLTPGGQYSLEVRDTIDGGFSTPVFFVGSLPGPEEYYSGNAESHEDSDDPFAEPFLMQMAAGQTVGADLLLNEFPVPSNDVCLDAIEIGLDELPFTDIQLSQAANMGAAEIPSACLFGLEESKSVWYSLSNNSQADVDLVVDVGGSEYLTAIQVFQGGCGSLVVDECFFLANTSAFTAEAGQDYRIRVTAVFEANPGGYLLFSVAEAPPPPPNDECTDAIDVFAGDLPFTSRLTTLSATTDPNEPVTSAACSPFFDRPPGSVWYFYTNNSGSQQHLFADTEGSNYDTVLQAYRGICAGSIAETCDDDSGIGLTSRLTLSAPPGAQFLFKATGLFETGGELVFNMDTFQEAPNDDCADAIPVLRSDLPFMDMVDARFAGNEFSEPETTCGDLEFTPEQSHSVYYSVTNDSTIPLEMELSTAGSEYDTVLQVYTGSCPSPVPEACDDDSGPSLTSELTLSAQPGATYLIKVSSWSDSAADILNFSARAVGAAKSQDVELLVSSQQLRVPARGNLDYLVAATNFGLDSLSGVSITTTLPDKTLLVSAGGDGVTCSQTTPTFTCEVGSLNAGQRVDFPVSVAPQVAGQTSLSGEADWEERTLAPPSTTVVRQVGPAFTLPTSFPAQAGQGIAASLQGTGIPFVGAAVVNLTDEANQLIVEGFDSAGEVTFLREQGTLLPAKGQTAFIVEDLPGLPNTTRTLLARGDKGELAGFFMTGNSPIDRLDGIGRSLPEARKLYLPLARSGFDNQTTQLDFFNPYPEQNDSIFKLFDRTGTQIAEGQHLFPAWGSLKISLQDLFDSPGPVDGYIEADAQEILRGFQISSSAVALASAVATPVALVSQLWSPHYFLDDRIGGATELRLINLESSRVFVLAQFFDEIGDRIHSSFVTLEPGEVFSEDVADFFGLQPPPNDRLTGHLRLDLVHENALDRFVLTRVRVIGVINFSTHDFYSSLPLIPFPRATTRFLQVAQSNAQQLFTGLAILSAFPKNADPNLFTQVNVKAINSSGQINAERTLELRHGERFLGLLSEDLYFGPAFEQVGGHLEINTDSPVFIFALFGDFRATFLSAIEGQ